MPSAAKRIKRGIAFTKESHNELRQTIDRLISNTRAAAAVFMTDDPQAARLLIGEKEVFVPSKLARRRRFLSVKMRAPIIRKAAGFTSTSYAT